MRGVRPSRAMPRGRARDGRSPAPSRIHPAYTLRANAISELPKGNRSRRAIQPASHDKSHAIIPLNTGMSFISLAANSRFRLAVGAVERRTGVPRDQIEAFSSLKSVAMAALGLKPGDVAVLSGTSPAEPTS